MKKAHIFYILLLFYSPLFSQSYNSYFANIIKLCSSDSIHENLIAFENLGTKEHGTPEIDNTLNWLIEKYGNYGYSDIEIDTFSYNKKDAYNLVITKTGTTYPNTYVVVGGHYDTKNGSGTSDNGSGVAAILEIARLLKTVNTEFSLKFINFSGEEDGLIGSKHYVNNTVISNNMDIKLMFNIDQVGGLKGSINDDIICERDESSPTAANAISSLYTDTLAKCVSLYSNLSTTISNAYASDYMPFQANNEIITGLYQKNVSPHTHTVSDNLANLDLTYVYEVTKAAIGASLYFATAYDPLGIKSSSNLFNVKTYPNPTRDFLHIDLGDFQIRNSTLKLVNIIGETLMEKKAINRREKLNLQNLPKGIYILAISSPYRRMVKKIIHQ